MPPLPGEERILTVFADVHCYFTPPTPRPLHHRFDKGSYLYVYHNATQQRTRLEIANNPGMREQDAFYGSLGSVLLRNSDTFPTLFTLVTEGHPQHLTATPPGQSIDPNDWLLTSGHPQDSGLHRIHTLDVYFWTLGDARLFLTTVQRVLAATQIDVIATQPPASTAPMSTVVQQLEQVAITDPEYQKDRHSAVSTTGLSGFLPPPPGAPTSNIPSDPSPGRVSPLEQHSDNPSAKSQQGATENYTPLAYNPAAPAAPEPIKHREKTPPPPDEAAGPGLTMAPSANQSMSFAPPPQAPGIPAAAPPNQSQSQGYSMPNFGQPTYASPPPSAGLPQQSHHSSGSISFPLSSAPGTTPSTGPQPSMSFAPPPQDPNAHMYQQQGLGQQMTPNASNQPQQFQPSYTERRESYPSQPQHPIGGYSDYSYNQPQQQTGNPYDIHNQIYRPTRAETFSHFSGHQTQPGQPGEQKSGKITENAMRVEKGVNRFLKKLERRL